MADCASCSPDKQKTCGQAKENCTEETSLETTLSRIKNVFMVMSGKGGVGKTSTAVNLAATLANKGYKIGLMDVDLHGPDVPRMLGLTETLDSIVEYKLRPLSYSKNLKAISIESLMLDKDEAIVWRGPIKNSAIRQFVSDVCWGDLDFLMIDSPPGTGDEPLSVVQNIPMAKAIIVTTPQEISLADVRKSIRFAQTVGMEILGLGENMGAYICPHCNETVSLFGAGGGAKTAKEMKVSLLGEIPFDTRMTEAGNEGKVFVDTYPDAKATQIYNEIAEKLIEKSNL